MWARVLALLAILSLAAPARAQDWSAQITPYAWGTGVGGTITPLAGGPSLRFDEGLSDVLEDLDAALFLTGYARYQQFVVMGDISHSASSRSGIVPLPAPAPGLPAQGRIEQTSLTLTAGYRALTTPDAAVDFMVGLRHWEVEGRATTPVPGLAAGIDVSFTDPILAARTNIRLSDRWSFIGYADVGGFGAGSDMTSQLVGTLNWQANDRLWLSAGYRHLYVDYSKNGRKFDATFSGPLAGLTLRF
ncbi:hypothetical protein [Roseovarius sp. 217]|uniref:hypothetical protein n=1 Tax=Roseovarius sp. (strain 217) TaxID=314264 RepID=UPI00006867F7|nr:hypothetical protein [Roseovarius sp. 217]EAQ23149.1 hypothetical protein ROS217_23845 [Roseovarius sp. 217]